MLEIQKVENKTKTAARNKKCSHVCLQEKNLQKIPKFEPSKDVIVVYLYNNQIRSIENLNDGIFPNLCSLYLQNNRLKKIDHLEFEKLRKLYIGHNEISVLENLENLYNLEELHVEHQNLPDGMGICFDPRCTISLSRTLRVLNISDNKIPSFSSLSFLEELQSIDASNCELEDLQEVCETISNWRYLTVAVFKGNPITKSHRYREDIIVNSYYLETLDGKSVSDTSREFLKRLEVRRMAMKGREKHPINLADVVEGLPKNYPPPLQKAVSAQLLKGDRFDPLQRKSLEEDDVQNYIAWRSLPKRRPFVRKFQLKPNCTNDSAITINKCA
ncbi:unnamed protein product [Phyllotreta striolata]|uniref:Protein phosphatase 1 regulatory subunit 42 n=1 Tax=Phyllotreta striolata TaxID=444603 RepID=A0A9N9TW37_PHYSR|nr:unnamed protein product [Phyllotreta striolata]